MEHSNDWPGSRACRNVQREIPVTVLNRRAVSYQQSLYYSRGDGPGGVM